MFKGFGPTPLGGLQDLVGVPTPSLQGLAVGLGAFRRGPCRFWCLHVTLNRGQIENQPARRGDNPKTNSQERATARGRTQRLGTGERDNQRTRKPNKTLANSGKQSEAWMLFLCFTLALNQLPENPEPKSETPQNKHKA